VQNSRALRSVSQRVSPAAAAGVRLRELKLLLFQASERPFVFCLLKREF
jgi:hypothetical protein